MTSSKLIGQNVAAKDHIQMYRAEILENGIENQTKPESTGIFEVW